MSSSPRLAFILASRLAASANSSDTRAAISAESEMGGIDQWGGARFVRWPRVEFFKAPPPI